MELLDAFVINNECPNSVVCEENRKICYLPNGKTVNLKIVLTINDLKDINIEPPIILYFPDSRIAYDAKKKTGSMILELLNDRFEGVKDIIISGLHVIASWEFNILAENDWGYIYLPIDASISGDFVPLYELEELGIRVGLGSGKFDSRFNVCDFPVVVWSAFLNQYNLLRDDKAIPGVWRAALGGWKVYNLEEPEEIKSLTKLTPKQALKQIYYFSRKKTRVERK
jgi:hypothetical protein